MEGLSVNTSPPPPPSLKTRDGGVFPLSTPSIPLPCSKGQTMGSLTHNQHHQPLPRSNCKTEGFSVDTPSIPSLSQNARWRSSLSTPPPSPPLLETRDGGVFPLLTPSIPLARKARQGGSFVDTSPPTPRFPVDTPSPPPPSLETQDGGGFSLFLFIPVRRCIPPHRCM